jgi:hypothetical protein
MYSDQTILGKCSDFASELILSAVSAETVVNADQGRDHDRNRMRAGLTEGLFFIENHGDAL